MDQVLRDISRQLPEFSPQLARAARLILENPNAVAVSSMRRLASDADVSPPTMLRLAQRMGFERYEDFRAIFKNRITRNRYGERARDLHQAAGQDGVSGVIGRTVAEAVDSIRQFGEAPFTEDIEQIADLLMSGRKIFVIGVSAMHGLVSSFHYVCRMVLPNMEVVPIGGSTPIDGLVALQPEDVVLGVSIAPYARGTVLALQFAKDRGAKIAAITDRHTSPLAQVADAAVIVGTVSPHYFPTVISTTTALEILSSVIAIKGGKGSVEAIAKYDTVMRSNNFYWDEDV